MSGRDERDNQNESQFSQTPKKEHTTIMYYLV